MLKSALMVLMSCSGPLSKAVLMRWRWPSGAIGMSRSRGNDIMAAWRVRGSTRIRMIVSARWPPVLPELPKDSASLLPASTKARESLPTSRKFCGSPGGSSAVSVPLVRLTPGQLAELVVEVAEPTGTR